MPGGLKNLIDWTSRFRPQPFDGRHGLVMSASPSLAGGNRGLWALRVPLEHLGARVFPDMFSLSMAHKAMTAEGLSDPALSARFAKTIQAFLSLAEAARALPVHQASVGRVPRRASRRAGRPSMRRRRAQTPHPETFERRRTCEKTSDKLKMRNQSRLFEVLMNIELPVNHLMPPRILSGTRDEVR